MGNEKKLRQVFELWGRGISELSAVRRDLWRDYLHDLVDRVCDVIELDESP